MEEKEKEMQALACSKGEDMYAIEKELKILRQFINPKHMDGLKKWKCYSEDEISAAEKRLHGKLPVPIRDIYLHMADLLITSGYLRPLELLHWEGNYLGLFLAPGEGDMIGIKKGKTSGDLYMWEENDPEEIVWEYEDQLVTAYEEGDEDGKRDDFKPLSDHQELICLGDFPLKMAYVHKDQKALLVLGQEPVCLMLLTKTTAEGDLLEKVQEQTGLAFHVGF